MNFRKNHEKYETDPFRARMVPFESPESQLFNGAIRFENGDIPRKLMAKRVDTFFVANNVFAKEMANNVPHQFMSCENSGHKIDFQN